ncbi:hypothetical protein M0R45_025223 [Rubus argutus]|uniref:Reverse transcriptase n=1 Tax=Rubus argutus TaxID=59490 RepID=A0AAW1WVG5_RUBAR
MCYPNTNGTMFGNGSTTVAIQGINLNSPSWADLEVIPPWAFKSRADFERANPLFPVPSFDNDSVLVPLPSAQPCDEELHCPLICPLVNKPITQRKRRARRPSPLALDEKAHPSKKGRPLISPSLRLSNSRGGRRGSRSSSTIRGRSRDTSYRCCDSDLGMGNMSSFLAHATHQSVEQHIRISDSNWSSSMKGDLNKLLWSFKKEGGGTSFTWYKMELGEIVLKERLDMGLISDDWLMLWPDDWLMLWPDSCVTHLSLIGSDHCPLLFNSCPVLEKKKKTFKFEAFWADDVECLPIIENNWRESTTSFNQALWRQNLSLCQSKLTKWSQSRFSGNRNMIKDLMEELNSDLILSQLNCCRREEINKELSALWGMDEKIWLQKSRINWLKAGDKNTKFFHLTTLHRQQRNRILKIANDNGHWIVGEQAIRLEFESHFQKVFECSRPRNWGDTLTAIIPVVTREMNLNLTAPFSLEEVKLATFQMVALKAPGPDGFPGLFYHKYWEVVNSLVFETSKDFSDGLANLSTLNQTHISLIPKIEEGGFPDPFNYSSPDINGGVD